MELAVIIPALNEAEALPKLLDDLEEQRGVELEVIVVDGGSDDATTALATRRGVTVVRAPAGRAQQMNLGAAVAESELLLFLHADTRLTDPDLFARSVAAYRAETSATYKVAGHFMLAFDAHDGHAFRYRFLERKTELNRPNTTHGDQGFLVSRRFFDELGGFVEDLHFLEDQRFAAAVAKRGRWFTLPGELVASSRRFETEGFGRRYLLMAIIMGTFDAGVEEFFREAPELYACHNESGELELGPYFEHIAKVTREMGLRRGLEAWFLVGRFIKQNTWQVPFAVDVYLEDLFGGKTPVTDAFDRHLAPKIEGPGWDAVTAVLAAEAFVALFPVFYNFSD